MGRVTSHDVARAVGLSRTTVSFVLNGRTDQGIPEATRQLVLDAADRLGYIPSPEARALGAGRSAVVLCALPRLAASELSEQIKEHLTQAVAAAGLTLVFARVGHGAAPLAEIIRHINPAAVIALEVLTPDDAAIFGRLGVPVVDGFLDATRADSAIFDRTAVGYAQVRHLARRGHRRIAYAAIGDPLEAALCAGRIEGARRACAEFGLPEPSVGRIAYTRASAVRLLNRWLPRGVTAVAAFNDTAGLAILAACRAQGVRVPQDLAVIGTDNLPSAALADPPLSSLAFDLRHPAWALVRRALEHVEGAELDQLPTLPQTSMRVVARTSTAGSTAVLRRG
jgi:DNA-binding LacI/PurR family transcriptional regulator